MPRFNHTQLAEWTDGRWTVEPTDSLTGFGIDTRILEQGQVFVAMRTEHRDGHDFLKEAAAAGAAAAIVSEVRSDSSIPQLVVSSPLTAFQTIAREHRRSFSGKVIGVTGSAGKTSTKNILQHVLGDRTFATVGNFNNHLGVPLMLTQLDSELHDYAVIEAGISGPGEMEVLASMIEPDAVVVSLIGHAHTESLLDLDGVATEKSRLPAAVSEQGEIFLPGQVAEFPQFDELKGRRTVVSAVEVLSGSVAEDVVRFLTIQIEGSTLLSVAFGMSAPESFTIARVSAGMAQNVALAIALARRCGISDAVVQDRLNAWKPDAMRGEVRELDGRLVYLDCYNANPDAMRDALDAFVGLTRETDHRLYVLGGMEELGEITEQAHYDLGASLKLQPQDRLLVVGTGAQRVKAGALSNGASEAQIQILGEVAEGLETMAVWAGPIFIKGSRRYRLETLIQAQPAVVG